MITMARDGAQMARHPGRPGIRKPRVRPALRGVDGARRCVLAALALAGCAGQPVYPVLSPPATAVFRAPYEAVWNATLQSVGVTPLRLVDRPQGHIVTEEFSYTMPVQAAGRRGGSVATQVLWVSLDILVRPTAEGSTAVQAQSTIHRALEYGLWPGPGGPNSPEGDLFARIDARLPRR